MVVIAKKYGMKPRTEPTIVRQWDDLMVYAELRDFLGSERPWATDVPQIDRLVSWSPEASEKMFLFKFNEYMEALSL